ncbi:MAG TPA: integrating conjugative element protein [Aquabacterium sp.]|nr:integrating conjugative element protein [Aquabacterium sp.]
MAVDIGETRTTPSQATPRMAAPVAQSTLTDEELAQVWSLSLTEVRRAKMLMQGPRGAFSSPQLSPIEVLGIHARGDDERERYARLFARAIYEDTLRVLAWSRSAQAEVQRITAGQPVIDFAAAPKAPVSIEAGDLLGVPRSAVVPPARPVRELKPRPVEAKALGRAAENQSATRKPQGR